MAESFWYALTSTGIWAILEPSPMTKIAATMSSRQNVNKEFMASSQLTKDGRAAQPRSLWPFYATLTGVVSAANLLLCSR
jgi:hypothetical protein